RSDRRPAVVAQAGHALGDLTAAGEPQDEFTEKRTEQEESAEPDQQHEDLGVERHAQRPRGAQQEAELATAQLAGHEIAGEGDEPGAQADDHEPDPGIGRDQLLRSEQSEPDRRGSERSDEGQPEQPLFAPLLPQMLTGQTQRGVPFHPQHDDTSSPTAALTTPSSVSPLAASSSAEAAAASASAACSPRGRSAGSSSPSS